MNFAALRAAARNHVAIGLLELEAARMRAIRCDAWAVADLLPEQTDLQRKK